MAKEHISYDPAVIQEFANRLYQQARSIIITSCLRGTVIGVVAGGIIGSTIQFALLRTQQTSYSDPSSPSFEVVWIAALVFALLGAYSGYSRGKELAFKLKLDAQVALCQVQIEKNIAK